MLLMLGKSPTSKDVTAYQKHPNLGTLVTPSNGAVPIPEIPWACDNDAFNGFNESRFVAMLDRVQNIEGCMWVAVPDVVGDGAATLTNFHEWHTDITDRGFPVALVAQDGMTTDDIPWLDIDCLFIGGTTEWKLGTNAYSLVRHATRRGKWVHMGRVNTWRRIQYAKAIGCDSFDGTKFARFTNTYLAKGLELSDHQTQGILDCE